MIESLFSPGDQICPVAGSKVLSGPGTYLADDYLYSSRVGVKVEEITEKGTIISIIPPSKSISNVVVPQVGDLVLARFSRYNRDSVTCDIFECNGVNLPIPFTGHIERIHMAPSMIDQIVLTEAFRPGDIIRAKLASWGDKRSMLLSILDEDLGVVRGISTDGIELFPVPRDHPDHGKALFSVDNSIVEKRLSAIIS